MDFDIKHILSNKFHHSKYKMIIIIRILISKFYAKRFRNQLKTNGQNRKHLIYFINSKIYFKVIFLLKKLKNLDLIRKIRDEKKIWRFNEACRCYTSFLFISFSYKSVCLMFLYLKIIFIEIKRLFWYR